MALSPDQINQAIGRLAQAVDRISQNIGNGKVNKPEDFVTPETMDVPKWLEDITLWTEAIPSLDRRIDTALTFFKGIPGAWATTQRELRVASTPAEVAAGRATRRFNYNDWTGFTAEVKRRFHEPNPAEAARKWMQTKTNRLQWGDDPRPFIAVWKVKARTANLGDAADLSFLKTMIPPSYTAIIEREPTPPTTHEQWLTRIEAVGLAAMNDKYRQIEEGTWRGDRKNQPAKDQRRRPPQFPIQDLIKLIGAAPKQEPTPEPIIKTEPIEITKQGNCRICGKPGHWARECPTRSRFSREQINAITAVLPEWNEGPKTESQDTTQAMLSVLVSYAKEMQDFYEDHDEED
jgi:hypothetical protein